MRTLGYSVLTLRVYRANLGVFHANPWVFSADPEGLPCGPEGLTARTASPRALLLLSAKPRNHDTSLDYVDEKLPPRPPLRHHRHRPAHRHPRGARDRWARARRRGC